MIPSLVVNDLRSALVEYLASTFALSDDDVRGALSTFLEDTADGIFRGPYLRVRTPFRPVPDGWEWPLEWQRETFVPHLHQGTAFERLSSAYDNEPKPTIVTTGTGSGKTECFLYPVLDHCARARAEGKQGIKALILYPMNALASDQAGRIAELIHAEPDLAGVTAGVYVGDRGRHSVMGPSHLVDKRESLRANPPDILLTNYKMLDFLLLRREDRDLWAMNQADTLQYLVLDEFHTYDGAQGTDVAMLLRRLGRTLKMQLANFPLGSATPIATSATLGSGPGATDALRNFAARVFGAEFAPDSVIGEQRQTVEEACETVDYLLPIPDIATLLETTANDLEANVAAFCQTDDSALPETPVELGQVLLRHPLTRAVLSAVGERSRSWPDAVAEIVTRAPHWGAALTKNPGQVEQALARYLWLLSEAKRQVGARELPLFSLEVQLWIREVSRLLRAVDFEPSFRWRDSASVATEPEASFSGHELPAAYCRRCGMSGWVALQSDNSDRLSLNPAAIYAASLERSPQIRALLRCSPEDASARHFDPWARRLLAEPHDGTVPVLATIDEDEARRDRCPGCAELDAIRFLGLRTASLASVSINTLFASAHVHEEERKLLAFTDSVQDASHRASFFAGRTHRINLRSLMASIIQEEGEVSLADLGDLLHQTADTDHLRFGLVPPDLLRDRRVKTTWTDSPDPNGVAIMRQRMGFEVDLEFGLRSRVGRTLELARVAACSVELTDPDPVVDLVTEDLEAQWGPLDVPVLDGLAAYVRGLLERLRLRGGLLHPFLDPYIADDGRMWTIWGGRPDGLPPFTPGQGRPLFYTSASRGEFDSLAALHRTPTWLVDWAQRSLGVDAPQAREANLRTLALLASQTDAVVERINGNLRVFGLSRRDVLVRDIVDDDEELSPGAVRCSLCGGRHPVPTQHIDHWAGSPCLRYRCLGSYEIEEPRAENYYRRLYREGQTRRVVTGEHTGLLQRAAREDLEAAFKSGTAPDAPNVLLATPTLEMGIDIGDLSAVMLTNVPRSTASYVQRVGRAGRLTGNSLVTTFVGTDTHGLYYLADPEAMIAGEVRPPDCYLDAYDTLRRQFIAYLVDRTADLTLDAAALDHKIEKVMSTAFEPNGLFRTLADAATLDPGQAESFVELFGDHLTSATGDRIREFAASGIELALKSAHEQWNDRLNELSNRRQRISKGIEKLEEKSPRSVIEDEELRSLKGQRQAVIAHLREHRNEYSLSALERLGLLPNYTLIDDGVTLAASMWSQDDEGNFDAETVEYTRSASLAIRELAPGNSFYAGGHRHVVDALDIGAANEPLYETWRLCPDCGYGRVETPADQALTSCPRCAAPAIADIGSRHTMLRLKTSLSSSSEEAARVFDEDDDRRREHYDIVRSVDVEPHSIEGAWRLQDRAFGAELASITHIRTINLGFQERAGERLPIAGESRHLTRFRVCRQCGAVASARDDRRGEHPERLHQAWCKVRSKALPEQWDDIVLYHELTTESIRLLLPISLFEVDERLVSFTGALLLGLREDFGGDPDHLQVVRSEAPNRGGQGKRRFLVLYDSVPGGTGYLARMADPDRVRSILEKGLQVISTCPCQHEGRQACHRCLLGVVERPDYDLASRELARELLEDLLAAWETEAVSTVADLDMGKVEESELERRFRLAIRDWVKQQSALAKDDDEQPSVTMKPVPGKGKHDAFELLFRRGDATLRYRVDEQEGLSTTPNTVPDFVIHRLDAKSPDVAVYLDGFQFHASTEHNNIASDAAKRAGIRSSGRLVWSLTWDDVDAFHRAAASDSASNPLPRRLLPNIGQQAALHIQHSMGGTLDYRLLNHNPMQLLLGYLRDPDGNAWERLALSAVGGAFAASDIKGSVLFADRVGLLTDAVANTIDTLATIAGGDLMVSAFETEHALRLHCILRLPQDGERWTVVASLPDGTTEVASDQHRRRWHDWLQWANVLQFIRSTSRDAIICASSTGPAAFADAWLGDAPEATGLPTTELIIDEQVDELGLLEFEDVRSMVERALRRGAPTFVAGFEAADGAVLEAAWPEQQVGILAGDAEEPLDIVGWTIRHVDEWTDDGLLAALKE